MKHTSSKMIITEMNVETLEQKRIFEGIRDGYLQIRQKSLMNSIRNKFRTVINFGRPRSKRAPHC